MECTHCPPAWGRSGGTPVREDWLPWRPDELGSPVACGSIGSFGTGSRRDVLWESQVPTLQDNWQSGVLPLSCHWKVNWIDDIISMGLQLENKILHLLYLYIHFNFTHSIDSTWKLNDMYKWEQSSGFCWSKVWVTKGKLGRWKHLSYVQSVQRFKMYCSTTVCMWMMNTNFVFTRPKYWNSLDQSLKEACSLNSFQYQLKMIFIESCLYYFDAIKAIGANIFINWLYKGFSKLLSNIYEAIFPSFLYSLTANFHYTFIPLV